MSNLLDKYNVHFYKQILNGKPFWNTKGSGLADFLFGFTDLDDIDDAITTANYYINGGAPNWENMAISADLFSAWLTNGVYNIYPSTGDTNVLLQSVPLQDFRDILMLWRDFLTS